MFRQLSGEIFKLTRNLGIAITGATGKLESVSIRSGSYFASKILISASKLIVLVNVRKSGKMEIESREEAQQLYIWHVKIQICL
jgi:hypothetical protein